MDVAIETAGRLSRGIVVSLLTNRGAGFPATALSRAVCEGYPA